MEAIDSNLNKVPLRIEDLKMHDHTGCIRLSVPNDIVSAVFALARDHGWGCQISSVDHASAAGLSLLDLDVPISGYSRTGLNERVSEVYEALRRSGIGLTAGLEVKCAYVRKSTVKDSCRYRVYFSRMGEDSTERLSLREKLMIALGCRDTGVIVSATEFPQNLESYHLPQIVIPDGYSLRARKPILSFYATGAELYGRRSFARGNLIFAFILIAIVGASISIEAYTMPITSRERAFRLSAFFIVGGSIATTGIPKYVRGKARVRALLWCTPLVLPILYPVTIAIGRLRLTAYLQNFGLDLSDSAIGALTILSAALVPVGISVFLSLVVVGIFGWIRYFVHRDTGLGMLMLIACIGAYFTTSVQWAVKYGSGEGVKTVAAVRAGKHFPEIYGFAPDLACVSPLKASIAVRGAALITDRPLYVFTSPQAEVVALWDSQTGKPTWVHASDVRILDVRSTHVQCPSG